MLFTFSRLAKLECRKEHPFAGLLMVLSSISLLFVIVAFVMSMGPMAS